MTVAEMIKKTRLDDNMTQEEYGNKFGVTRQTVSSWETGKSMPDLQMLITICNTYKLSLDLLLNNDSEYVKKVDLSQKFSRSIKRLLPVLGVLIVVYFVMFGIWKGYEHRENAKYQHKVEELGFALEDGHYVKRDDNVQFELPNQKLPFLQFDFNAQVIRALYRDEEDNYNLILNYDNGKYYFSVAYNIEADITGVLEPDGKVEYQQLSEGDTVLLDAQKDNIEEILFEMMKYYNQVYEVENVG